MDRGLNSQTAQDVKSFGMVRGAGVHNNGNCRGELHSSKKVKVDTQGSLWKREKWMWEGRRVGGRVH